MNKVRTLCSSVFVKLLLVCLLAWLLITIAVSALFLAHRVMAGGPPYNHLLLDYLERLVADIDGQEKQAAYLTDKLQISVDYQGEDKQWSQGAHRAPNDLRFFQGLDNKAISYSFGHDIKYIRYKLPTGTYTFAITEPNSDGWLRTHLHFLALVVIALIFSGTYLVIRRILAPISALQDATQKVGKGDLNHEVHVAGCSELAKLAGSFNDMVRQVHEMITSKEQLLRDVSHELRSPLTRIKVLLEMVEPPERVEQIRSEIRELEELITAILETTRHFHQLNKPALEEADPHKLVAERIKRQGEGSVDIVLEPPESDIACKIDSHLFSRVIDNLLSNALTHGRPASGPVQVRVRQDNGCMELTITDSGPGISDQDLPHIMEPFYQADKSRSRARGGFGLGLSLCKAIVEAHGGELIITGKLGRGTEALVRLPCKT